MSDIPENVKEAYTALTLKIRDLNRAREKYKELEEERCGRHLNGPLPLEDSVEYRRAQYARALLEIHVERLQRIYFDVLDTHLGGDFKIPGSAEHAEVYVRLRPKPNP